VVVNDVPLLAELGYRDRFELVVVVQAPVATRIERLMRDRGMSRDEAGARIAAQATDEQRRAVADVVIDNDGTLDDLRDRVDAVWHGSLLPARR
jgi:dephospho-CoA kinase